MAELRAGFIGTGRKWDPGKTTGFGMNYSHAAGYKALPDVKLAACADLVEQLAKDFARETGAEKTYTDYRQMLAKEKLDIVSISTWPGLHEEMVRAACEAGVKVIHCEKPIADTWGACKRMAAAAKKHNTRLSFNHQRRFGGIFLEVKRIKASGRLGKLVRMEATPPNLCDWGTHWLDMMQMFNDEAPAKWVLCAIDPGKARKVFGMAHEGQALLYIHYENEVQGLLLCSLAKNEPSLRFIGDKGVLEVRMWVDKPLAIWKSGSADKEVIPVSDVKDGDVTAAIAEVVNSYRQNRPCELGVDNAMRSTEIIFAAYESARRRGRVDLPISIEDHPFISMLEKGELKARE